MSIECMKTYRVHNSLTNQLSSSRRGGGGEVEVGTGWDPFWFPKMVPKCVFLLLRSIIVDEALNLFRTTLGTI
jgi:hypothetical protein